MKNIYLKAAKIVAKNNHRDNFACCAISSVFNVYNMHNKCRIKFTELFGPKGIDSSGAWLDEYDLSTQQLNNRRVLALLFMHEMMK